MFLRTGQGLFRLLDYCLLVYLDKRSMPLSSSPLFLRSTLLTRSLCSITSLSSSQTLHSMPDFAFQFNTHYSSVWNKSHSLPLQRVSVFHALLFPNTAFQKNARFLLHRDSFPRLCHVCAHEPGTLLIARRSLGGRKDLVAQ